MSPLAGLKALIKPPNKIVKPAAAALCYLSMVQGRLTSEQAVVSACGFAMRQHTAHCISSHVPPSRTQAAAHLAAWRLQSVHALTSTNKQATRPNKQAASVTAVQSAGFNPIPAPTAPTVPKIRRP